MRILAASLFFASVLFVIADGPQDNIAEKVRPVPPEGVMVPAEVRADLQKGVDDLGKQIATLKKSLAGKPQAELLPDVEIFHNSVRYALSPQRILRCQGIPHRQETPAIGHGSCQVSC